MTNVFVFGGSFSNAPICRRIMRRRLLILQKRSMTNLSKRCSGRKSLTDMSLLQVSFNNNQVLCSSHEAVWVWRGEDVGSSWGWWPGNRAGGSPPSLKDWILADRSCLNDRSLLARANICRREESLLHYNTRPPTKVLLLYDDPYYPNIVGVTKWTFTSLLFINLLLRIERDRVMLAAEYIPLFVFVSVVFLQ